MESPLLLLHVDGAAGISGDMTLGALVDLGVPVEALRDGLSALGVAGWSLTATRVVKGGLSATRVRVEVHGEEEHPSEHAHHHHHHDAHGRGWPEISRIISSSGMPARPKEAALATFCR